MKKVVFITSHQVIERKTDKKQFHVLHFIDPKDGTTDKLVFNHQSFIDGGFESSLILSDKASFEGAMISGDFRFNTGKDGKIYTSVSNVEFDL